MKRKTIILAVVAAAAMALSLVGCGVKITNIAVPESAMVEKGESITLPVVYGTDDAPAVTPETAATGESAETDEKLAKAASKLTVEWTSSDESVATVDATGMVVAVSAGEADITASVTDSEMSAVCKVTVKVAAKDITVPDNLDVKLNDGNETTVEATVSPADATDVKASYASTDEAVATVDKDGRVQVLQPGECDITTTLMQDGEKVTEKTTHVKAFYEVESITLDSNEGKLTVGNSHTIKATVAPEEVAAETTIEWSSSNEKVATVDENGKVKPIGRVYGELATQYRDARPAETKSVAIVVDVNGTGNPINRSTLGPGGSVCDLWMKLEIAGKRPTVVTSTVAADDGELRQRGITVLHWDTSPHAARFYSAVSDPAFESVD